VKKEEEEKAFRGLSEHLCSLFKNLAFHANFWINY
jgi:hypothetical protein